MSPPTKINDRVEAFLARRGFYLPEVRTLIRNQLYLVTLSLGVCLVFGLPPWALAFFAGTALITMNFWFLAKGLQNMAQLRQGSIAISLVRFYGRMFLTGLALFGLIVWAGLPVAALLAGLTTVVINILFWGIFRFNRQKVKGV
jgi:hypothetical protein